MSRQSLAVNSSGALTGTLPSATTSVTDLHGDVERAGGSLLGVAGLDLDGRRARSGSLAVGADLGALR